MIFPKLEAAPISDEAALITLTLDAHPWLPAVLSDTDLHVGAYAHATHMWACMDRAMNLFLLIVDFVF